MLKFTSSSRQFIVLVIMMAVMTITAGGRQAYAQGAGPVAAYAFSEASGSSVLDSSGNGNHGTLVGAVTRGTGYFGNGVALDGTTSGHIEIPMSESLAAVSDAFTIEAWINPTDMSAWRPIVNRRDGYVQLAVVGGQFVVQLQTATSGGYAWDVATPPGTIPVNTWTHVAATYDGTTLRLYVNGVQGASQTLSAGALGTTTQGFWIGQPWWSTWAGGVDEVRIYRTALDASALNLDLATPIDPNTTFEVSYHTPRSSAVGVLTTPVTAAFSRPADASTVSTSTFELLDSSNALVPATVTYNAGSHVATLTPIAALQPLSLYTAKVVGGAGGVADTSANTLSADVTWTFTTVSAATTPVAAYAFSEGAGTTTEDESGNGNTGAVVGAVTWATGYFGGGVTLDGTTSGHIEVPMSESLAAVSSAFTLEAWISPTDVSGERPILNRHDGTLQLAVWDGRLLVQIAPQEAGGYAWDVLTPPGTIPVNTWTHVATTYDGTTLRLYINGVQAATQALTGTLAATTQGFWIGQPWFSTWAGSLDEIRIYRTALSATDIANDMTTPADHPELLSLSPTSGRSGQSVTLSGSHFGTTQGASSVTFSGIVAAVSSWSATSIAVTVPSGLAAGAASVVVSVNGVSSNALSFSVVNPQPLTIVGTTPSAGALGVLAPPTITFGADVNVSTLTASTFSLHDASNNAVAATITYAAGTRSATLTPNAALTPLADYTARVVGGGGGVQSSDGGLLAADVSWTYHTAADVSQPSVALGFYEGSGTSTADLSGNGNAGVLAGNPQWIAPWFLYLPADTDGVDIAPSETLAFSNAFALEAYLIPFTSGRIWSQLDSSGNPVYELGSQADGKLYFAVHTGSGTYTAVTPSTFGSGIVAAVYDGAALKIYKNGSLLVSQPASGTLVTSSNPTRVGHGFTGYVAQVRAYRRALTPVDVFVDYNTQVGQPPSFLIYSKTPAAGTVGVTDPSATVTFTRAADPSTINSSTIQLLVSGTAVPATVTYDASTSTASITAVGGFQPVTRYTVTVVGGSGGVMDPSGATLSAGASWSFTTANVVSQPGAAYAFTTAAGSLTNELDVTGNGNTATYVNSPFGTSAGRFGHAAGFGTTQKMQVPVSQTLTFTTAVTFEGWIRPTASGGQLWQQSDAGGTSLYALSLQSDRTLSLTATIGGNPYTLTTSSAAPLSAWTHVAVTYDGSILRLYMNGVESANAAATGSLLTSGQVITLASGLTATLDEIRLYRRALTAAEINTDMITPLDPRVPIFNSISPSSGVPGQPVTLTGDYFNAVQDGSTVTYNSGPVTVTSWSSTSISAVVPNVIDSANFVITVGGQASVGRPFTMAGAPSISSISPTSGTVGTAVTINGSNFGSAQFASSITLAGAPMQVISWSSTFIQASVPARALTGPIAVTVGSRTATSATFTAAPFVTSLAPASGTAGDSTVISGQNFGATQGTSTVKFNGTVATVTSWSNTSLTVTVPQNAGGAEQVIVAVGALSSGPLSYWVVPSPVISSLNPTSGAEGTIVSIAGQDFGATQGASTITFNGLSAAVMSWSQNQIVATVPTGATTGGVAVAVNGRTSNNLTFTVRPSNPLTVTAQFNPTQYATGWFGAGVTITFTCSTDPMYTVSSCPFSASVFTEGPNQVVTRSATDSGGNTTVISVLVNLDLTNPTLSVTSPSATTVFPAGTTSVTISGSARDALSGLQSVTCGGTAATLSNGSYSCVATVADGTNKVHVVATDDAGHTTAQDVTITVGDVAASALTISPAKMTLAPGWGQQLTVTDQLYRVVTDGTWSVSDDSIAEVVVDENNITSVHALALGTAVLTVTRGGLSAHATVTVAPAGADGFTLPAGTQFWSLAPSPEGALSDANLGDGTVGFQRGEVLRGVPTDAVGTGLLFFVEHSLMDTFIDDGHGNNTNTSKNTWPTRVRAVTPDGRELWTYTAPTPARQVAVDDNGGVLLNLGRLENVGYDGSREHSIQRVWDGGVSWEYNPGDSKIMITELAVHSNGKVFFVENNPYRGTDSSQIVVGASATLVALDEQAGGVVGRWPLYNTASGPIVSSDGTVKLVTFRQGSLNIDRSLWMVSLDTTTMAPTFTMINIDALNETAPISGSSLVYNQKSALARGTGRYHLVSDGNGGYLLPVGIGDTGGALYRRTVVYHMDSAYTMTGTIMINQGWTQLLVGEDYAWALSQEPRATVWATPAIATAFNAVTMTQALSLPMLYDSPSSPPIRPAGVPPTDPSAFYMGPHQMLRYAEADGGVVFSGPRDIDTTPVLPGTDGGWDTTTRGPAVNATTGQAFSLIDNWLPLGAGNRLSTADYQSNYNAIELATDKTVDDLFAGDVGLAQFSGAVHGNNPVANLTDVTAATLPITRVGQVLVFELSLDLPLQNTPATIHIPLPTSLSHFVVETTRFDLAAKTIAVRTVPNEHPLDGVRYWRVFSGPFGRPVIETGAVDLPAPDPKSILGFYMTRNNQIQMWKEFLLNIKTAIGAEQATDAPYTQFLLNGIWGADKNYIMTNVCGHAPAPSGFCQ